MDDFLDTENVVCSPSSHFVMRKLTFSRPSGRLEEFLDLPKSTPWDPKCLQKDLRTSKMGGARKSINPHEESVILIKNMTTFYSLGTLLESVLINLKEIKKGAFGQPRKLIWMWYLLHLRAPVAAKRPSKKK